MDRLYTMLFDAKIKADVDTLGRTAYILRTSATPSVLSQLPIRPEESWSGALSHIAGR
jgi:hypothetical protein